MYHVSVEEVDSNDRYGGQQKQNLFPLRLDYGRSPHAYVN